MDSHMKLGSTNYEPFNITHNMGFDKLNKEQKGNGQFYKY